ncbi:MAG: hypothetical protein WCI95_01280 [bacterium]
MMNRWLVAAMVVLTVSTVQATDSTESAPTVLGVAFGGGIVISPGYDADNLNLYAIFLP